MRDPEADPYINWLGLNPLVLLGDIDNVFVAITPFILEVNIPVEVEKFILLFEITEEVAITPLIVVVKVLPVRDWVKDEMNCLIPELTPLIIFSKKLLEVEAMLVLIIFTLLELDPPILEESVLLDEVRVLEVLRLVTFRLVVVPELAVKVLREELPNTDWLPKIVDVVAVIVSVKRLEKYPVILLNVLEKKLVEEEFVVIKLFNVALFAVRLIVLVVVAVIVSVKRLEKYPVMLLNVLEKKLVEEEFVVIRLVVVAFVAIKLFNVALFAVRLIVLVVVAVIVSAKRLEKYPVILLNVLEKKLVEEEFMKLELVEERLLDVRFCILAVLVLRLEIVALVIVALPNIGLSVNI